MCSIPFSEKAYTFKQCAASNTARREYDLLARGKILSSVNPIAIVNAHVRGTLPQLRCVDDQPCHHLAMQTAQSCSRQHTLRRSPRTHHCVYSCASNSSCNTCCQITITDQL